MRRIAIVGCRPPRNIVDIDDPRGVAFYGSIVKDVAGTMMRLYCEAGVRGEHVEFVSGGADGADAVARGAARGLGAKMIEYRPDYAKHGRAAPLVRNSEIVVRADEVHAWPAPWSRGTWDTVRKAQAAGKPTTVHEPWKDSR